MECANQCPFIDRVDHRCSSYFSLDRLDHTFEFCFDQYKACPLFRELMAERRLRRVMEGVDVRHASPRPAAAAAAAVQRPSRWVAAAGNSKAAHAASRLVQVTVSRTTRSAVDAGRYPNPYTKSAAAASFVPAPSGV